MTSEVSERDIIYLLSEDEEVLKTVGEDVARIVKKSGSEGNNNVNEEFEGIGTERQGLEEQGLENQKLDDRVGAPKRQRLDSLFGSNNQKTGLVESLKNGLLSRPPPFRSDERMADRNGRESTNNGSEDSLVENPAANGVYSEVKASKSRDGIILVDSDEDGEALEEEEIVILDAEEAAKSGKFKPTSFDKEGFQRSSSDFDSYSRNLVNQSQYFTNNGFQGNTTRQVNDPSRYFNQPVPAPHFTHEDRDKVSQLYIERASLILNEKLKEKAHLLAQHDALISSYSLNVKKANEALQSLTDLQNMLKSETSEENRNETKIFHLRDLIAIKGAEYQNYRRDKDSQSFSLKTISNKLAHVQVSIRDATQELNNYSKGDSNLQNSLMNGAITDLAQPSQPGVLGDAGFASNIYLDKDQQDIQNLLNNIRPDEELEEEGLAFTPQLLNISLLKHQRMGLSWLIRMEQSDSKGGILADDMGLGKTVQAIALMVAHKPEDLKYKTTLVIAPVSLLRQWAAEIESKIKPGSQLKIGIFHASEKKELSTFNAMSKYDVILTSYGTLSSEWKKHYKSPLEEAKINRDQNVIPDLNSGGSSYNSPFFSSNAVFYRIILDEAQNIKNKTAIASKALYCVKGIHRLCLSGTPIQNNVDELFPLLRFLRIKPYNNEAKFRADIALSLKSKSNNYDEFDKKRSMQKLQALLRAILLRRSKDSLIDGEPILSLPEKHLISNSVQMEEDELGYYKNLEQGIQKKAKTLLSSKKLGSTSSILTLLLRLRQACCHSFLVEMGQMKAEELQNFKLSKSNSWKEMYLNIQKYDDDIVNRIKSELHQGGLLKAEDDQTSKEDLFTCPICYDVLGYESIVLFAGCGHMICNNCIETFFERYETGDGLEGNRLASCFSCSKTIKESELIDYNIFHKIHYENYSYNKLAQEYGSHSKSSRETPHEKKIQQLIKENNGFKPSAKMEKCISLVKDVLSKNEEEKIIIFSQFLGLFDLLAIEFAANEIKFLRYDGTMSLDSKNNTIKNFYQSDTRVLFLSLRAGNVGLTLTCASHVIIMDPFWNPYVEEQAMDRAHRIGQQREVYVHRILIEGSVESRIITLQDEKKEIVSGALDEKGMKSVSTLGRQELGFLFGLNSLR